jgi:hypothetical protein
MAVPITVTTSPVLISRTAAKPYLINNDGTTNVYLGQDTAVNNNNYAFILQPGQSLSWSEINKEVYAVTTTGTSKVSIAYEAAAVASSTVNIANATIPVTGTVNANITNASIPVSGSVSITSGTVGISGTVNTAITSGSVSITSGSVSVSSGNITAAVGNTPVLLGTATATYTTASTNVSFLSSGTTLDVDISAYSSVLLVIETVLSAAASTTNMSCTNNAYYSVLLYQYTGSYLSANPDHQAQFTFGDGVGTTYIGVVNPARQTFQIPVKNSRLALNATAIKTAGTGTGAGTSTIKVYGTYETITNEKYVNYPSISTVTPALTGVMYQTTSTTASTDIDIPSRNGAATITLVTGSATLTKNAVSINYYNGSTSTPLTKIGLVAPGLTTVDYAEIRNITLPNYPLKVSLRQTGTTLSQTFNLTQ